MEQNLRTPGPTPIPDAVRDAQARPMVDHRGTEFAAMLRETATGIAELIGAGGDVVLLTGSGTGALEAAVVNTLSPGDRGWLAPRTPDAGSQTAPVRFSITLPAEEAIREYSSSSVAVSPDGRWLAYAVDTGSLRGLRLRRMDSLEAVVPAGTEGGTNPFFSPDSQWLGFETGGLLKKLSLTGGSAQPLAEAGYFGGACWTGEDSIVFVPVITSGLYRIPASGGRPVRISLPDRSRGERAHLWPEALPDGRTVLFTIWTGGSFDGARIAALSLATGEWRTLLEGGSQPRYLPSGHLLFTRGGNLLAVRFDAGRLRVEGTPLPMVEGLLGDPAMGAVFYGVSPTGLLAFAPGAVQPLVRAPVWVDRSGVARAVGTPRAAYTAGRVSPDGRRLALWIERESVDVWIHELARGTLTRLTAGPDDHSPAWSPDGTRVVFESGRTENHNLFVRNADGTGEDVRVTTGAKDQYVNDWSPDGRWLAYTEFDPETGADIAVASVDPPGESRVVVRTTFSERKPTFSRDGRWLAYVSNESGREDVYAQPFPGPGTKLRISSEGGDEPAFSHDGRELYYRSGDEMMSVPLRSGSELLAGPPRLLFRGHYHYNVLANRTYDVAPDGRFLMVTLQEESTRHRRIDVVVGWTPERPAGR